MTRDSAKGAAELRQRAEQKWATESQGQDHIAEPGMERVLQELKIHEIELEMQNDELRKAQLELTASRDRYADLYEFAPSGYLTLDQQGIILEANLAASRLLDKPRLDLIGYKFTDFVKPESQDVLYLHLRSVFAGARSHQNLQCDISVIGGDRGDTIVHIESLRGGNEDKPFCQMALIDITEKQVATFALFEAEQRYRRISNAVSDFIYHIPIVDGQRGKIIPSNDSEAVTGYSIDEIVKMGDPGKALVHPDDWPAVQRRREILGKEVDTSTTEFRIISKSGDIRWVAQVLVAKRDQNGILLGYDGILQDISDRKKEELALRSLNTELDTSLATRTSELRESHELMTAAMTSLVEGVMIVSRAPKTASYSVVFANNALSRMSGQPVDQLLGKSVSELRTDRLIPEQILWFEDTFTGASPTPHLHQGSLRLQPGDDEHCDVEMVTSPIYDEAGELTHLVLIYRDVTSRKAAEQEISQRDAHISAILDTVADAILTIDVDGQIKSANPVAIRYFGYSEEELLDSNISRLFPGIISSSQSTAGPIPLITRKILGKSSAKYSEQAAYRHDGSTMPVGIGVREIDATGLFTCAVHDLSLVKSLQRQILNVVEEENRRIGHELHDNVQQQLVGVRLLVDKMQSNMHPTERSAATVNRLITALDHVIGDLRVLCRGMVSIKMDGDGLRSALNELAAGIEKNNGIACRFASFGKLVIVDQDVPGHLFRIAQEAITNSLKHADAGNIDVSLTADADGVILKVCDNGVGIKDEDLELAGMGVQIMRYRAALIGADLTISRLDAGGTCLVCTVPTTALAGPER